MIGMDNVITLGGVPIFELNVEVNSELFGVQYHISNTGLKISNYAPSLVDLTMFDSKQQNVYEIELARPYFLPINTGLNGFFEEYLEHIPDTLDEDEVIKIAIGFHKRNKWKEEAVEMYQSYLNGVNYPMANKHFRMLQQSFINAKSNVLNKTYNKEYSQDIEDKITDVGYSVCCNIHIQSEREGQLVNLLQDIFNNYAYHNAIRLKQCKYKSIYHFEDKNMIFSAREILSLCKHDCVVDVLDIGKAKVIKADKVETNVKHVGNIDLDMLPIIEDTTNIEVDEELVSDLAEAMKRIGLIKQARLYNTNIQAGCRLTVIQSDIPKGLKYTDIYKKLKDIQVAMGLNQLDIEQGDNPDTVKFSIPNDEQKPISLRQMLEHDEWNEFNKHNLLSIPLGYNVLNKPLYMSLRKLPHLLVAGTTGSGKSVFLNQLIFTLLMNHTPKELQMFLIDPKKVELMDYEGFPHVQKVVTDMEEAKKICFSLVNEMENRYEKMSEAKCKEIEQYNDKTKTKLPYLVFVIDEFADLMIVAGESIEDSIMRLGQKARACGIHLIIATQRPSADILSGKIKANIQNAISFNLESNRNYRTVFDEGIPYKELLGKGDGVCRVEGIKRYERFQSCTIHTDDNIASEAIQQLKEYYNGEESVDEIEIIEEESMLDKLKQTILDTGETRVSKLREVMEVKSDTMSNMMMELVNEGFLIKHKNRSKGYELVNKCE